MPVTPVGGYMAHLRTITGMTQKEFAKAIGVSRSFVSAVENGDRHPDLIYLRGVRKRFGISIDALFDDLENSPDSP